jgi:hypothetical protein
MRYHRIYLLTLASAGLLLAAPALEANRLGQGTASRGGGGGQRAANVQRPAPQRPANIQRPANTGGGRLPSSGSKPAAVQRPSLPSKPSGSVQRPQMPTPGSRPAAGDKRPSAPASRPANLTKDRPNKPVDLGGLQTSRPKLPGNDKMAGLADRRPSDLTRPAPRPGPNQVGNAVKDRRPGAVPPRDRFDKYPGLADNLDRRPGGYDTWQQNREKHWDSLHDTRADRLDDFQVNRDDRWDNISSVQDNRQDFYTNRREDWQSWADNRQVFRQDRAWEVLDNARDYHSNLFVPDWYYGNSWWRPAVYYRPNINPWTWWRPAAWTGLAAFFGGAAVASALDRDYGTQVYYDQTNYYIEGQPVAPAPQYRQEALELAAVPPAEEPFVPVENDDENGWYPLGVWALTQEEKGDAVMFYQLAVNKQGEVSGAYSNVLTGETSPVTGSVDFETQRVAWRTGSSDTTAMEANLAGLTKDFTPVFVHYGTGQTQEWLLVRMEDPS